MIDQNNSPIYNVSIYHLDNQFYITPMVRKPPGARTQVLPLYIIPDDDIEKMEEVIESARLKSDVRYQMMEIVAEREEWDGDNEKVWNTAQKNWDIIWRGDGSVSINFAKPYVKHRNGVEWIFVPEAKKILEPPVVSKDIAQEIIRQTRAK